jgi:hypothetical protein
MDGKNAKEPDIPSKLMESCDYIILTIYQTKMEGLTLLKVIYYVYFVLTARPRAATDASSQSCFAESP